MKPTIKFGSSGFTLVEMMIAVSIIALLTSIAIPAYNYNSVNLKSQNASLLNDYRTHAEALIRSAMERGDYTSFDGSGPIPSSISGYLPYTVLNSPVGGHWNWDHTDWGITAGISLSNASIGTQRMSSIDEQLDDGDLSTGAFRKTNVNRYTLVIEE